MGTIVHQYDPNQDVYVIEDCENNLYVTNGTVIRVRIEALVSGNEIIYDIRLAGKSGTTEFMESDVFVDKPTALTEYDTRLA